MISLQDYILINIISNKDSKKIYEIIETIPFIEERISKWANLKRVLDRLYKCECGKIHFNLI